MMFGDISYVVTQYEHNLIGVGVLLIFHYIKPNKPVITFRYFKVLYLILYLTGRTILFCLKTADSPAKKNELTRGS